MRFVKPEDHQLQTFITRVSKHGDFKSKPNKKSPVAKSSSRYSNALKSGMSLKECFTRSSTLMTKDKIVHVRIVYEDINIMMN